MWSAPFAYWLDTLSICCAPLFSSSHHDQTRQQLWNVPMCNSSLAAATLGTHTDDVSLEKHMAVHSHQPAPVSPPSAQPDRRPAPKWGLIKGHGRRSVMRKLKEAPILSSSSKRRLQISAPTNFRHLNNPEEMYHGVTTLQSDFDHRSAKRRRSSTPSVYTIPFPEIQLSPIMPYFQQQTYDRPPTPPPPPLVYPRRHSRHQSHGEAPRATRHGSPSTMSFHLSKRTICGRSLTPPPYRRPVGTPPPLVPARSLARDRAHASPSESGELRARIANEARQAELDSIVHPQSTYFRDRSSFADRKKLQMGPMPLIPVRPATGPSFAERLSIEGNRPVTAPMASHVRTRSANTPISPYRSTPVSPGSCYDSSLDTDLPLTPPLPLVLRPPPLRKKKAFSRVSEWLFSRDLHARNISLSSVTNAPRPITSDEGFYQCFSQFEMPTLERTSIDTYHTSGSSSSYSLSWGSQGPPASEGSLPQQRVQLPPEQHGDHHSGDHAGQDDGQPQTTAVMTLPHPQQDSASAAERLSHSTRRSSASFESSPSRYSFSSYYTYPSAMPCPLNVGVAR